MRDKEKLKFLFFLNLICLISFLSTSSDYAPPPHPEDSDHQEPELILSERCETDSLKKAVV